LYGFLTIDKELNSETQKIVRVVHSLQTKTHLFVEGLILMDIELLANKLKRSSLVGCTIDSSNFSFALEFSFGLGRTDVVVKLYQIVHSLISKNPDDQESCFFVGNLFITPLYDGGLEALSSLKYSFNDANGGILTYPSRPLWHLHLEGGICLDVVFGAYQILQEIDSID
jgi:hypothetical protein